MTLDKFLRARLADDSGWCGPCDCAARESPASQPIHAPVCESRVLVEVDLKRQLQDLHRPSTDHGEGFEPYCVGCWEAGGMDGAPSYPCPTTRTLASLYVGHPDYRREWRP